MRSSSLSRIQREVVFQWKDRLSDNGEFQLRFWSDLINKGNKKNVSYKCEG